MDFVKVSQNGYKDYYFKVNKDGAKIVVVNEGAVTLTPNAIKKMLNFRRSFDYSLIMKRMRVSNNVTNPTDIEYNVENDDELLLVKYLLTQRSSNDFPSIKITRIDLDSGKVTNTIDMPVDVVIALDNELKRNGFEATATAIKDIMFVKELPNETSADPNTIYYFNKKLYVLNNDQDAFAELTGTFKQVNKLPDFESLAKEGVLYNLTNKYTDVEYGEEYERGIYTYKKSDNSHTLEDLKIVHIKKLPDVEKADSNVIFILTRDDVENERLKDSAWILNDDEFVEETREIIDVTKLPFAPIAEHNVYYVLNGGYIKQADTKNKKYHNIGQIVQVDELPDISTVQLEEGIVYVLTQKFGDKARGTRWVFNHTTKEFEEFEDVSDEEEEEESSSSDNTNTDTTTTDSTTDTTIVDPINETISGGGD